MKHFNLFLRKYKKFLVWKTIFYGNYKQLVFSLKNFFREGQVIGSFKWTSKKFSFRKLVFLRESIIFFFWFGKNFWAKFFLFECARLLHCKLFPTLSSGGLEEMRAGTFNHLAELVNMRLKESCFPKSKDLPCGPSLYLRLYLSLLSVVVKIFENS